MMLMSSSVYGILGMSASRSEVLALTLDTGYKLDVRVHGPLCSLFPVTHFGRQSAEIPNPKILESWWSIPKSMLAEEKLAPC